jgi:hypothetical protein
VFLTPPCTRIFGQGHRIGNMKFYPLIIAERSGNSIARGTPQKLIAMGTAGLQWNNELAERGREGFRKMDTAYGKYSVSGFEKQVKAEMGLTEKLEKVSKPRARAKTALTAEDAKDKVSMSYAKEFPGFIEDKGPDDLMREISDVIVMVMDRKPEELLSEPFMPS